MSFRTEIRADLFLLVTALIWGFAFVFQSMGMDHVGPVTFVFGRFVVAAIAILPIWYLMEKPKKIFHYQSVDKKALQLGVIMALGMLVQHPSRLFNGSLCCLCPFVGFAYGYQN